MAVDSTSLGELLKRRYTQDQIARIQQTVADVLSIPTAGSEKPGGEDGSIYSGIDLQIGQAGGAQNQNDQFRTDEYGVTKQAKIMTKINIWHITLTKFANEIAKGNAEAFMPALKKRMDDAAIMLKKDENRQLFGYGYGVLALVNGAVTNDNDIIVDTPGVQYFYPGMRIDVFTALTSGTKEASNVKISSIDVSNLTITLDSNVTVSNNSYIVRAGVLDNLDGPTADGKEFMGLLGITDDTTLFTSFEGISRDTYPQWKGTIVDASSAALTSDLVQRLSDKVENNSGRLVDTILSHRIQRRQYLSLTVPQKRFLSDKLDAGFQVLEWNGIKWAVSLDCYTNRVFAFRRELWKKYEVYPTKLDDDQGIIKNIPLTDTIYAYYKHYANTGTWNANAFGRLDSLATLSE